MKKLIFLFVAFFICLNLYSQNVLVKSYGIGQSRQYLINKFKECFIENNQDFILKFQCDDGLGKLQRTFFFDFIDDLCFSYMIEIRAMNQLETINSVSTLFKLKKLNEEVTSNGIIVWNYYYEYDSENKYSFQFGKAFSRSENVITFIVAPKQ